MGGGEILNATQRVVIRMAADFPSVLHRTLHLPNGVAVALVHDPQAVRVALVASVAGGSFHEPAAWPGLAHCVEHCVFLGSRERPGAAEFADYVHAHGGRYNARTLALQTLYFLEMPAAELSPALAALCGLLASPLFVAERVRREVEVLDAEYQARCADAAQQLLGAIAAQLPPGHPMSRFHAGARDTLPAHSPEFLAALRAWHARHYCGRNLRLLISGPQSLDALERCARESLGALPAGPAAGDGAWPALWPAEQRVVELALLQPHSVRRMSLWWPLQLAPAGLGGVLALLRQAVQHTARGSLPGELRALGWAQRVAVELQPADAGTTMLVLQLDLLDGGVGREREIAALCADWLARFATDRRLLPDAPEWQALCREQAWREYEMAPLERAALWVERWQAPGDWQPWLWHAAAPAALAAAAAPADPQQLIVQYARAELAQSEITPWFPVRWQARHHAALPAPAEVAWQAPPANPFLVAGAAAAEPALPDELAEHRHRQGLRPGHAALLLCWRAPGAAAEQAARLAEAALALQWRQELQAAARLGCEWLPLSRPGQLRFCLSGPQQLLPRVLSALLIALDQEQGAVWQQALREQEREASQQMLLRRLLAHPAAQWWPDAPPAAGAPLESATAAFERVQRFIHGARLHSLCLGNVPAEVRPALAGMGRPAAGAPPEPVRTVAAAPEWRLGMAEDEQAVLLRLLDRRADPRREAAWRLLAVLWQGAYYQALRVEQGLGYALFSRFHAGEDAAELQFGVQSPHVPVERLREAIQGFLARAVAELPATSPARLQQARRAVLDGLADPGTRQARLLRTCHAWLAAQPAGWAEEVRQAAQGLQLADLAAAAAALLGAATLRCWVSST